ncbi:MAG: ribose 5-phosphate isomerase B [Propionibacteriaceae bacterium]|jgi:ribose 5-phosphate isomerase B|nr:ribose 5-phosphate isomerase B [Propionibacteriaceae bacterium]
MHIILANDHAGVELKRIIADHLTSLGHTCTDLGTNSTQSTDYPLYGSNAARMVVAGEADFGILICGSGIGISISANKVPGARCALASEPYSAMLGRSHNNANLLALGARVIGPDLAKATVDAFLSTDFAGGERHSRRVAELAQLDAGEKLPLP